MVKLTPEGFVIDADAPGTILVRVRWTPYWSVVRGTGCVEESPTGFTRVMVREPGRLRVDVDFSPWRAISRGERCAEADPPPTGGWEQAATWKGAEQ